VASLVPDGFEAYVRILHETDEEDSGSPSTWAAVAAWSGRTYHPVMQFDLIADPVSASAPNAPFTQPDLGHLAEQCQLLYDVLARGTSSEECWVGIWDGHGSFGYPTSMAFFASDAELPETRPRKPLLERASKQTARREREAIEMHGDLARGSIDVAHRAASAPKFELPGRTYLLLRALLSAVCESETELHAAANLVWPDDHSWWVATEIDFDSTLVGGSRELADDLLQHSGLEVVEVRPEDRLDEMGDEINAP
jgi:hypothetical protein